MAKRDMGINEMNKREGPLLSAKDLFESRQGVLTPKIEEMCRMRMRGHTMEMIGGHFGLKGVTVSSKLSMPVCRAYMDGVRRLNEEFTAEEGVSALVPMATIKLREVLSDPSTNVTDLKWAISEVFDRGGVPRMTSQTINAKSMSMTVTGSDLSQIEEMRRRMLSVDVETGRLPALVEKAVETDKVSFL